MKCTDWMNVKYSHGHATMTRKRLHTDEVPDNRVLNLKHALLSNTHVGSAGKLWKRQAAAAGDMNN
jgi:hypothetical protein